MKVERSTFSFTYRGKAMDAKLQTAVSVGLENSIISVQRFEDLMVPRFCWLLFLLQESWRGQKKKKIKKPKQNIVK